VEVTKPALSEAEQKAASTRRLIKLTTLFALWCARGRAAAGRAARGRGGGHGDAGALRERGRAIGRGRCADLRTLHGTHPSLLAPAPRPRACDLPSLRRACACLCLRARAGVALARTQVRAQRGLQHRQQARAHCAAHPLDGRDHRALLRAAVRAQQRCATLRDRLACRAPAGCPRASTLDSRLSRSLSLSRSLPACVPSRSA
jgi:hypothetical protein